MISKSCLNLSKDNTENLESIKSCFSYDDWLILKKHPEIEVTLNNYKKSYMRTSPDHYGGICDLYYDCESIKKMYEENDCYPVSENQNQWGNHSKTIKPNVISGIHFDSKPNSNTTNATSSRRNSYEYLSPYQKKLKEQKSLQTKLGSIENKILERKMEFKTIEKLLTTDLNVLHLKKLQAIGKINEMVNSVTDKIFEIKSKRMIVSKSIKELNRRMEEIEEMIKLKEVNIRECYLKIHQKGRQAFLFTQKSEIMSSVDIPRDSNSCFQINYLQDILKDIKSKVEELKNQKLKDNYSNYPSELEYRTNSYLVTIARDCLLYYLTSKSEERIIHLRAMIRVLPYPNATKEKLLETIKTKNI